MNNNVDAPLEEALSQVFEQMAFMWIETPMSEEDLAESPESALLACLDFDGPLRGRMDIAVSSDMAAVIAQNVLGLNETARAEAERIASDALKEMLNVACGRILTDLGGTVQIFHLGVPVVEPIDAEVWDRMQDDEATRGYLADEHPMLVRFRAEEIGEEASA